MAIGFLLQVRRLPQDPRRMHRRQRPGAVVQALPGTAALHQAEARAELTARNPQGRLVQPEEVASAVAWLCLPEQRSMTGQAIAVAGGEVM